LPNAITVIGQRPGSINLVSRPIAVRLRYKVLLFKEESCEWMVVSRKIKITNKGDCKYCNGCTITTSVTLLIDATSGKVKDRIELKHVTKNYE
jgi:hypothetical protein